jgi:hypothetical protein
MDDPKFEVGNDILDLLTEMEDEDAIWSILEWAAAFYSRTERPANIPDLIREKPSLARLVQYR